MQMDDSHLTDQVAAQVGCSFPDPSPRRGLARGARQARAGRWAVFIFRPDRGLAHGTRCARVGRRAVFVFRPDSSYEQ
jgi:hypothetical protein